MKLGIRRRVFLVSFVLVVGMGLLAGLYLEEVLRTRLEQGVENNLRHLALTAREAVTQAQPPYDDQLADRLGKAAGVRVTIIGAEGIVRGDSQVTAGRLGSLDNHGTRPEILEARRSGQGASRRHSATLETDMLYLAVPLEEASGTTCIRVAMPLSDVDEMVTSLRVVLLIAGVLALGLAFVVSSVASYYLSRTLRELVSHARAMAQGKPAEHLRFASEDELGGLAGSFREMAEELDATVAALARERDRFETILDGMSDAVVALDDKGKVTLVNQAAVEMLKLPAEVTGKSLSELDDVPTLEKLLTLDSVHDPAGAELDIHGKPYRRVLAKAAPLRSTAGTVIVVHDITEMRRVEAMRRDFVANVSHELRTPVSVIRANTETVLDSALSKPDQARRFLDATLRNAERLSRLIADLLDLSRIEAGEYALDMGPTLLLPLVNRVVEAVEAPALDKRITIEVEVDPDMEADADGRALEQVLLNLLDNAVKYTKEQGTVKVRAESKAGTVRLEVSDNGPGIKAKHRKRVFERFYRVDPGRSREMGGTGLGLAITKHLCEAMGGSIGVEKNRPQGARFWVHLVAVL